MNFVTPCSRFALTTSALCRAVAACLGRGLMDAAMIVLVWGRVRRAEVAFLALVERVQAGRYRGGWSRVSGAASGAGAAAASGAAAGADAGPLVVVARSARARLPRRFGWLMAVMPYEAACFAGQLRTVLAEPEMAAILRDVAPARRILGPVCRMLGVEMPGVEMPGVEMPGVEMPGVAMPAVRLPRVAFAGPRVKRVRAVLDLGRVPLPRGVLAAARRQGFGRLRLKDA